MKAILGKKIGTTQVFTDQGKVVPVTLVEAGPCTVLAVLSKDKNGYEAVQLGFELLAEKKVTKSMKGKGFRYIKEFRFINELKTGDTLDVSLFKEGDKVKVSGISKGKGTQGGVKRWGFHGRNATRGTKHEERTIGSVGAARPSEVWLGKKMPGHLGFGRVSTKNVQVVKVDPEHNIIALKGAVPGMRGTLVEIVGK
ncbi:MAG: 50S ribosomal protein L3 [Candidatus Wildermuthbacteria bacterium RIFCSPLOWO2_01_FULL_47_18]|uniref:50S ribosomal protein L3 n=1 Tax=Candidatus Wildermuthbacteria bacterium RIFCSPLOWO2_01_FULL_47_18 TaxID=1802460 RepID=A0A1G2RFY6_9BACT|nr:MAG: 50S ribosomal protein L3 [Candidatus Wildermuthbacteria bacterium RIFCSPLOWO2_01_FULL_47_18]